MTLADELIALGWRLINKIHKIINSNPCHNWICWEYIPIELKEEILTDYIKIFGNPFFIRIIRTNKWVKAKWIKEMRGSWMHFHFETSKENFNTSGENYTTDRDTLYRLDFNEICRWWIGYKISTEFTTQEQLKKAK